MLVACTSMSFTLTGSYACECQVPSPPQPEVLPHRRQENFGPYGVKIPPPTRPFPQIIGALNQIMAPIPPVLHLKLNLDILPYICDGFWFLIMSATGVRQDRPRQCVAGVAGDSWLGRRLWYDASAWINMGSTKLRSSGWRGFSG